MIQIRLLEFFKSDCVPCRAMKKTLDKIMVNFDNIEIIQVDVEQNHDLVVKYGITSVPALVVEGEPERKLLGFKGEMHLISFLMGISHMEGE